MDFNAPESMTFSSLDQKMVHIDVIVENMQKFLTEARPASIPSVIYDGVKQLHESMGQVRKLVASLETERRSLRALAQIGEYVNSSLDLNDVLQIVMDTIIHITRAERGFLMLRNEKGDLNIRMARNWEQESIEPTEFAISSTVVNRVANTGQPILTTNAQEDPRFNFQQSVVAYNLRSILCTPLKVKDEMTGVIYADNRIRSGLFTQKDLDLLYAFANQAAVAIENARLFASVRRTLAEVTELKNLMDNVFASITSGVVTADTHQRVIMCNRAAETILGQSSSQLVGYPLGTVAHQFLETFEGYLDLVLTSDQPVVGLEANPTLPQRGQIDLRLSLSPLKDAQKVTQGFAIVLEDLTEKKHLEGQRRLFERMVSPAVIGQLDPNRLQLGGQRTEISVIFADIRGFTGFSEKLEPEELVAILNCYLAAGADAILNEGGTIDKFLGDAVMAWFNAPIPQADHALRAVRAALSIQEVTACLEHQMPQGRSLAYGIGIHVGDAILGLIGTEKRLEYTAIGDAVNTAKRIQENAGPGQILITQPTYDKVKRFVRVAPIDAVHAKGKRDPITVYEVLGLIDPLSFEPETGSNGDQPAV